MSALLPCGSVVFALGAYASLQELLALEEANAAEIARLERLVAAGQQRLREIREALDVVTADLQAVAAERTALQL